MQNFIFSIEGELQHEGRYPWKQLHCDKSCWKHMETHWGPIWVVAAQTLQSSENTSRNTVLEGQWHTLMDRSSCRRLCRGQEGNRWTNAPTRTARVWRRLHEELWRCVTSQEAFCSWGSVWARHGTVNACGASMLPGPLCLNSFSNNTYIYKHTHIYKLYASVYIYVYPNTHVYIHELKENNCSKPLQRMLKAFCSVY